MRSRTIRIGIAFAGALTCAHGQWLNYPTPGTPRTRDGKPNLSAPAPRLAKGKPDLSGLWQVEPPAPGELERMVGNLGTFVVPGDDPRTFSKYFFNILADFKPGESPIRPEADALFKTHVGHAIKDYPTAHCLPIGPPGDDLLSVPFKIIQTPAVMAILYEVDNTYRQIYTDGRPLPADPQPSWLGYSIGRWEGDTLVVDTVGLNDKAWLDAFGHARTESLHLQERFRRTDFGHLELQITIDDPKTFTKPFTIKVKELLVPDSDVLESICDENEKDSSHLQ